MSGDDRMAVGNTRRVIAAGAIGNVLEWYDFAIYGYFAAAIGRAFFPQEDPVAQVLAAFGIFAVGYPDAAGGRRAGRLYRRPLRPPHRAHLLGDGDGDPDLPGRRPAGLPHAGRGRADPAHAPAHDPGPVGRRRIHDLDRLHGRACAARPARPDRRHGVLRRGRRHPAGLGDRCAAGRATVDRAMEAWGWRIPFLLGLVVGLAGFFAAPRISRSAVPAKQPTIRRCVETLRDHGASAGCGLPGFSVFNAVGFYLMFVYIVSWLQFADGIAPAHALEINSVSMVVLLPLIVAMGWLSRPARPPAGAAGRHGPRLRRRLAAVLADASSRSAAGPARASSASCCRSARSSAASRRVMVEAVPARCAARRSRSATTSRWASSAASARWSRRGWCTARTTTQPGLHDHGGRGDLVPRRS